MPLGREGALPRLTELLEREGALLRLIELLEREGELLWLIELLERDELPIEELCEELLWPPPLCEELL